MIYLSTGLPGCLAFWCDHVLARLIGRDSAPEVLNLDTLDDFAAAAIRATSRDMLVISRRPVGRLRRAMAAAGERLIVSLDQPYRALADVVGTDGMDVLEAIRYVAGSCASVAGCAAIPNALVLDAAAADGEPAVTVAGIARHFGIALAEAESAAIVESLAEAGITPRGRFDDDWWSALGNDRRTLVEGALGFYSTRLAEAGQRPITWERELFFINEDPASPTRLPAVSPVDVTGRPRCLVYGPFIALPPGPWSAAVALGFSREAAEIPYLVEITAERQLASARLEPGAVHFHEVHLDFTIEETTEQPVQVRIWNDRAAFDGQVALGHVTVAPQRHIRSQTLDFFAAALTENHESGGG